MSGPAGLPFTRTLLFSFTVALGVLSAVPAIPDSAIASPIMIASTHAAPARLPLDLTGFELRETTQWRIAVLPQQQIEQQKQGAVFHLAQNTLTLTSAARKPTAYHARQPRTELCESRHWRIGDGASLLDEIVHIDTLPKQGRVVLAELSPDEDTPVLLQLALDGDRVVLTGALAGIAQSGVTIGSLAQDRHAHVTLRTEADGQVMVALNGTINRFRLLPAALAIPVAFRTGAHVIGDIGTTPDQISVTLSGLVARHGPARSDLRS